MYNGKKIIFSGVKPTNIPTLGNYLGAIKNWVTLQDEYKCLYSVVDMHSLTVRNDSEALRNTARKVFMLYIACGIDPGKSVVYYQSHLSAHAELAWVLSCYTYMGELSRMTQFKEKSQHHAENINAGLFTYPVLMAADILLFQTELVPVGEDQRQHLEIARDIAERFNNLYGKTFVLPEVYTPKRCARVMDLQDPLKKMSKTDDNNNGVIFMLDEPSVITNKIKRAVTDSDGTVRYSDEKPGISNLLDIYSSVTNKPVSECEKEFDGVGYGTFKKAVAEAVVSSIEPIQSEFRRLENDKAYVDNIIKESVANARQICSATLADVYKKVGLPDRV